MPELTSNIMLLNFYSIRFINPLWPLIAELKSAMKDLLKEDPYFLKGIILDAISEDLMTKSEFAKMFEKLATKEDLKMLIEMINKRFEAIDKRFEDMQRYMEKRFEAIDKRFEDMRYYIDKRFEVVERRIGFLEKLIVGFNLPILLLLLKLVLA